MRSKLIIRMPEYPTKLPQAIADRLEGFRKKLWWMKAAEAILAGIFGLLLGFVIVFVLERFVDTPVWIRIVLLASGTSIMAIFAPAWIHRWLWKHRRPDQLAKLVRRAHPRFGDRLLGAVELATQDERQTALSPVLREAALRQIAAETERRGTLEDALPRSLHRRWAVIVFLLTLTVVAGFVYSPEAGMNSLVRWAHPLGKTPRYTFTQLKPLPARMVVPQGEPFSLALELADGTKQQPASASVTVGGDMPMAANLDGRAYPFRFNGMLSSQSLAFSAGDAHPTMQIVPLPRPAIGRIEGEVQFPDYLGMQTERLSLEDGKLTLVEGAKLAVRGETTRPIASASLIAIAGANPPVLPALRIDGTNFTTAAALEAAPLVPPPVDAPPGTPALGSRALGISFTDVEGLAVKEVFKLTLNTVTDAAPNIYMEGVEREVAILDDEVVDFRVIAGDDFGVKRIGIDWTILPDGAPLAADVPPAGESVLGEGVAVARRLESPGSFSPEALKLGPQTLRVRAWAEDFKPGRGRSYSEDITVVIMDRSQHAEMLRRRFGQLMDGLEELSRREETDHEENKRLDKLEAAQMREQRNKERLAEQTMAEQKNRGNMEQLDEAAKELFRDALRNKDMDAGTMKNWSEMLKELGELSKQDMPKVEEKLQQAGDADNQSPEQQDKNMADAVKEQQKVLEKMREAMRKANRVEQNMEAGTFVNRLRSAARTTKGLAGALRETMLRGVTQGGPTRTAGLNPDALEKDDFTDLLETAKRQDRTRIELGDLQEDFGHFFRRTNKPVYEEIRKDMEDSRTVENFDRMAQQIRKNWAGRTTPDLLAWGDKLSAWADKLDPKKDAQDGGGGGGGGGDDDSNVELMLRLLRFVQQTQDIQGQTRRVEHGKEEITGKAAATKPPMPPAAARPVTEPNPQ